MNPTNIKCLAVDADIVCFRVAAVHEESTLKELHEGIDEFLFNVARNSKVHQMLMFLSDKTNFRYDIAKTIAYKHNRYDDEGNPKVPKPRYLANAKEYILKKYKGHVELDYEADDCIASFMTMNEDIAHAGIDKDIRQIQGWHYNFVKDEWSFTDKEESELLYWRQVCTGDYGDGIPGLYGIGQVKAKQAVNDYIAAESQAFALYEQTILNDQDRYLEMFKKKEIKPVDIVMYFEEQKKLIKMVDTIPISWDDVVTINPPPICEPDLEDEDSFTAIDLS